MNLHITSLGKGKPLVLFHGWGFDQRIWFSLAERIKNRFSLHLVDLPGFGQSPLMNWSLFKESLLTKIAEPFTVLGWSLGGLYAMRLAVEEARVTSLVSIASSPCFLKKADWLGVEQQFLQRFIINFSQDPQKSHAEFIALQLQNQAADNYEYQPGNIAGQKQGLQVLSDWDLRKDLLDFSKPACFAFGRLDKITPHTTLQAMQTVWPNFNYQLFNKAAHVPFLSHEDEFVSLLENFLL